jgi:O-antigen ligase
VALAFLAPLSTLALDPGGWYPFGPIKWLVVASVGFGGAGLVLLRVPLRLPRSLAWSLALLTGWLGVAAAVGLDPLYAWTGTPERHLGVVTWVLCALLLVVGCSSPRSARPWLQWGLVTAGFGVGAVATAEALGWEPGVLDVASRLTGTFGSPAYLGAAVALLLPVCVGLAADRSLAPRLRLAAGIAAPLLVVAGFGSGARAAWLGLVVAAATTAWARRSWLRAHRRWTAGSTGLVLLVLVVVVAFTPVGERLGSLGDPDAPGGRARFDEWRVAARVLVDHPLTGVGPEGYRIAFHEGVDAAYERAHGRDQQPDRAHSAPLDIALAGGLPGLAAWLAVVVLVGRAVLSTIRRGRGWTVGLAAGLVAHLAGQLVLFPIFELEPLVWLLAGLVVAAAPSAAVRCPEASADHALPDGAFVGGARWVAATAAALALGLAALGMAAGVAAVVADRHAEQAVVALDRGDDRAAVAAAQSAVRWRPDIVRLRVLAARALVGADRGTLVGIRQLDQALQVSPGDPIVLRERLELLIQRAAATGVPAHLAAAQEELDRLLADDPHNAAYWRAAEELAELEGDRAAAATARRRWSALQPAEHRGP